MTRAERILSMMGEDTFSKANVAKELGKSVGADRDAVKRGIASAAKIVGHTKEMYHSGGMGHGLKAAGAAAAGGAILGATAAKLRKKRQAKLAAKQKKDN